MEYRKVCPSDYKLGLPCCHFFCLLSFVSSRGLCTSWWWTGVDATFFPQEQPLFFREFSEAFRVQEASLRVDRRGSAADILHFLR